MRRVDPFKFGVATSGEHFTDRETETERLVSNFRHGINTILISPRRWGKTSLVKKVSKIVASKELRIVALDVFACRNEEDFCNLFATSVLKQTSSRWEEWVKNAQTFLSRISPKITLGADPTAEMSLSFDLKREKHILDDVLGLTDKIAEKNGYRIVVCIDEFQQIGEFADSLSFQKRLRAVWQHQKLTSYCLFGSKKHLMDELFGRKDYPFYKFGDTFYLQKISTPDWVKYICERFRVTDKVISEAHARQVAELVDNHSSYVQQLAWLVWSRTEGEVTNEDIRIAVQDLINQNRPLFEKQTEELTAYQLNFLRMLCDGHNEGLASQELIEQYSLGSSANVSAVRSALMKKELIEVVKGETYLSDPVMKLWLREYIF